MLARLKEGGSKLLSLITSSNHGSSNGYGMTRYIRGRDMVDPKQQGHGDGDSGEGDAGDANSGWARWLHPSSVPDLFLSSVLGFSLSDYHKWR